MTFEEWIEGGLSKDVKRLKNESIKAAGMLINLVMKDKDSMEVTRGEIDLLKDYEMDANKRYFHACKKIMLAKSYPDTVRKIEELIAKKEQLEAKRDNATDLDKELLLAEIEQIDDQLADSRKEYIRCKQARDDLMKEYKEYNKEVAA